MLKPEKKPSLYVTGLRPFLTVPTENAKTENAKKVIETTKNDLQTASFYRGGNQVLSPT